MKIKALILTVLFVGAGVASSLAQVYSANAVGYVNVSVPASGRTILANPLNNGDNHADTIMPLDDTALGLLLFRFDPGTQNYMTGITFAGTSYGWVNANDFSKNPPELFILNPGEGFFVQNVGATLDITFVGDVPQGNLSNPITGQNNRNLLSSQVPQEAPLGDPTRPGTLEFPAEIGDLVFLWDDSIQNFDGGMQFAGPGYGWVDLLFNPINGGDGNIIPVGKGFFVQKQGDLSQSWDRTFSVN